ncbi:hypothetical protein [Streptomyces mirabilis]|uniref:hypothetical protein n=1 Tax=Streptomyces mirabilis TaxID=68239 RepID=UPI0036CB1976
MPARTRCGGVVVGHFDKHVREVVAARGEIRDVRNEPRRGRSAHRPERRSAGRPGSTSQVQLANLLGPAALAYGCPEAFRPVGAGASTVEQFPASHPDLRLLEQAAGCEDAGEAALDEITSPVFAS